MEVIPLLTGRPLSDFTPLEYREHVKGLFFKAPPRGKKEAAPDVSFRRNAKGTPIITVRNRKPKWMSPTEIDALADKHKVPKSEMWLIVKGKKIEIKLTP